MSPIDLGDQVPAVQPPPPPPPVERPRPKLALMAIAAAMGLAASVPATWAYNQARRSYRVLQHASEVTEALHGPQPIRSLMTIQPEQAPLCPPSIDIQTSAAGRNRFPIRTRFLLRLRRAPT